MVVEFFIPPTIEFVFLLLVFNSNFLYSVHDMLLEKQALKFSPSKKQATARTQRFQSIASFEANSMVFCEAGCHEQGKKKFQ